MAKFTLSAITASGEVLLTYFDAATQQFGGLTFDEAINESTDTTSLTFSALKYRVENGQKVINLPITALTYSSVIRVYEHNTYTEFKVQSISYTFLPDNLQLQFTCLDRFQAECSKLAIGYTIEADTSDPNFLGAQSIDTWARKILRETNLAWGYIDVDVANDTLIRQLTSDESIITRDDITNTPEWEEFNDALINEFQTNPATLNAMVSFECSSSNAFEALKSLANNNELILRVDYPTNNIYFIPQKNWWFKGYYFNPHINLQQLALQGDGQNLATVLNVIGPRDVNDQDITLVPNFPPQFEEYVGSSDWKNSHYYEGFYQKYGSDVNFATLASLCPWLENKLIDFSFFRNKLISAQDAENIYNILTNQLRIINAPLMVATRAHLKQVENWIMQLNEYDNAVEARVGYNISVLDQIYNELLMAQSTDCVTAIFRQLLNQTESLVIPIGSNITSIEMQAGSIVTPYTRIDPNDDYIYISIDALPSRTADLNCVFKNGETTVGQIIINVKTGLNIFDLRYDVPAPVGPISELDSILNERIGNLNTAWQKLNRNADLLKHYWEDDNYRHETFYRRFRKLGVYTVTNEETLDRTMQEELTASSPWSAEDPTLLTQSDIEALNLYFNSPDIAEPVTPTRSLVIQTCADIEVKMTQYWSAMREAGLKQGCYIPKTWNCLDCLDRGEYGFISPIYYSRLLPLVNDNGHYKLSTHYGSGTQQVGTTPIDVYHFRYFDQQRDILNPLITNNTYYLSTRPEKVIHSNTDNYYQKVDYSVDSNPGVNLWYYDTVLQRTVEDTVQLYRTKLKYREAQYENGSFVLATTLWWTEDWGFNSYYHTIIEQYIQNLLHVSVQGTMMYQYQEEHNKIWQHLYAAYPGIFVESTYENQDAATSMDLYFAAKAQLETINHPEFSYNLTGIDIYSRNNEILLWDVNLGDQVRIDYVEDEARPQVVDTALREPLYVTGINHSLRDDGNYQFTVATRKATDTMVRRFARLLTLGR